MDQSRVVAIVQARMGSTRLPHKVLLPILGTPMLALIVDRVRLARTVHRLVIATTERSDDDPIATLANDLGVPCFRGADEDCLDRYHQAAQQFRADVIVRLTADNPVVDWRFVDWMVEQYFTASPPYDYFESWSSKHFPTGLTVEVVSSAALERAWREDTNPQWREHVTPYIYHHSQDFKCGRAENMVVCPSTRWTVDTSQDLEFVRRIFEHFGHNAFSWQEALELLEVYPEWRSINSDVPQRMA